MPRRRRPVSGLTRRFVVGVVLPPAVGTIIIFLGVLVFEGSAPSGPLDLLGGLLIALLFAYVLMGFPAIAFSLFSEKVLLKYTLGRWWHGVACGLVAVPLASWPVALGIGPLVLTLAAAAFPTGVFTGVILYLMAERDAGSPLDSQVDRPDA